MDLLLRYGGTGRGDPCECLLLLLVCLVDLRTRVVPRLLVPHDPPGLLQRHVVEGGSEEVPQKDVASRSHSDQQLLPPSRTSLVGVPLSTVGVHGWSRRDCVLTFTILFHE